MSKQKPETRGGKRKGAGRPTTTDSVKLCISLPRNLMARVDATAKHCGLSRSALIALAVASRH